MANFAEGFGTGIGQGINLSREMKTRSKERTSRDAMAILAQVEQLDPYTGVFTPDAQGVPEPGQPTKPVGLSDLNRQYFDTIGGFQDIESYAAAKTAWGATQMGKVNEYGMAAIGAYDRGDMDGAKKLMTAATSFVSPNTSSEVQIDPKTGQFVIANYDAEGNPSGGLAMSRDDILDFVNMNNNPQAWANAEDVNTRFGKELGLRYDTFNEQKRATSVQEARLQGADDREAIESQARLVNLALERELKLLDVKGKDKATADALKAEANTKLEALMSYNKTEAGENKAEFAANMDLVRYIQQSTKAEANSYTTMYSNAESKAGSPYAGMDITKMTLGELRQLGKNYGNWVAGQTEEGDFSTPLGRYQIVGDTRDLAQRGLRLPDSTVFTPEIQDRMAVWVYQNQGPGAWVAWDDSDVPPPAAGAASAGALPDPNDPAAAFMASDDDDKTPPKDEIDYLPWFYNEPNAEGERTKRENIWTSMDVLMDDLHDLNPEASAAQIAGMTFSTFGPKDETEVVLGDKGEPSYLKDGVSALEISPEMANLIDAFNVANQDSRELYAAARNPEAYQAYSDPAAAQPAVPDGGPAPAPAPEVGAAEAAAPAPAEAAAVPGVPQQAAPQATVDDTAVTMNPVTPTAIPVPEELPPALTMNPEVADAVQAWIDAGRPSDGPVVDALSEVILSLPMQERGAVTQALSSLSVTESPYGPQNDPRTRGRINTPPLSPSGGLY